MMNGDLNERSVAPNPRLTPAEPGKSKRRTHDVSRSSCLWTGAIIALALVALAAANPNAPSGKHNAFSGRSPSSFTEAMDVLHHWTGPWRVTERHFDRMGKVVADTVGSEEGRWILDGHAVRRVYRSAGSDKRYEAEGTLSWSEPERRFRGVWFDNLSTTGPSIVTGEWNPDTHTMIHTIERVMPDGKSRTFRTVERFTDHDHRRATTYEVNGNELVKLIEVEYARTAPCPESRGGIRIIRDGLDPHDH